MHIPGNSMHALQLMSFDEALSAKVTGYDGSRWLYLPPFYEEYRYVLGTAGEVLDVDGELGGYNFQWAWSGGAACNRAAARWGLSRR